MWWFKIKEWKQSLVSVIESFELFFGCLDIKIVSLNNRFWHLKKFESIFGLLYDSRKSKSINGNELK